MSGSRLRVRCRQILDADVNIVIDLLLKSGFARSRNFWVRGLRRMAEHPTPPGFPKYGVLLEVNDMPVGVLLMICTAMDDATGGAAKVRCNFSSWFVWPGFRNFATMLVAYASRNKEATYFNISPLAHTWPILEAQGFSRYCAGRFVAVPALKPGRRRVRLTEIAAGATCGLDLSPWQSDLLRSHVGYGCIGVVASLDGKHYPFLFDTSWQYRFGRVAYLVYSPSLDDFVRFAGPLGRFLLRRRLPVVVIDANGPIPGLVGRYYRATPKFYKGPDRPRLGDLAYSEQMILGFIA
jgi:hypothetical protein